MLAQGSCQEAAWGWARGAVPCFLVVVAGRWGRLARCRQGSGAREVEEVWALGACQDLGVAGGQATAAATPACTSEHAAGNLLG